MIAAQTVSSVDSVFKQGDAVIRHGIVMPDQHPTDPSLYKINIGNMTASDTGGLSDGIWCTNNITPFTRFKDGNNNSVSMGQYFPLLPYMPVTVMMSSGGAGQGMVVAPAKTNVGLPDPENKDDLYMVAQTPKGSWIAIDDKTGTMQLMFNEGSTSVVLAEDNITLEIGKGESSGKKHGTSLSISEGSFIFRTRDSMMKFDESGLSVGFDSEKGQEKSSNMSITRDSVKLHAGKNMQFNAQDSMSSKAEKLTLEGIKDASLVGNHVKVNGAQITSIKGTQIELEAFWNVQLKGMYIGTQATVLHREITSMKHTKAITHLVETNGVHVLQTTSNNNFNFTTNMILSAFNAMTPPPCVKCGVWFPAFSAAAAYAASKAAAEGVYTGLKAVGTAWMVKTMPIAVITNALGTGTIMAAAGNRSESPSPFLFNARNKNSQKSINSGIATSYSRKNQAMENLSVVDPLIQASMTAVTSGGTSPAGLVTPDPKAVLAQGIDIANLCTSPTAPKFTQPCITKAGTCTSAGLPSSTGKAIEANKNSLISKTKVSSCTGAGSGGGIDTGPGGCPAASSCPSSGGGAARNTRNNHRILKTKSGRR